MFLVEICCAYLSQIFLYFFTLSVTMIFILYTSQRFLETFFFVLGRVFALVLKRPQDALRAFLKQLPF